jgi:tetratricopeptide (TPR) repeat protein
MSFSRRNCFLPALLMLAWFSASQAGTVTKTAVFPLVNKTRDKSLEWISAMVPEYFSRQVSSCAGLQVLSPAFLFPLDSAGWTMDSDSLLKIHRARWGWNAACGGAYTVANGRINCEFRTLIVRDGRPSGKLVSQSAPVDSTVQLCLGLFAQFASVTGYALTKADYQALRRSVTQNAAAYATYCAGFGFEMRGSVAAALTSYARAVEIDPSFAHALYRMARLSRASGDIESARRLFKRAAALSGDYPDITAAAADFYDDHDVPDRALDFVNKNRAALERTPEGMMAIGKSFLLSGELQRAIAMLTRSVAAGPADLEPDFALGKAYMAAGEFAMACDVFNRLVQYRPDCARYYALLGAAYRNSGRLMEALRVLEFCARDNPDYVPALVNLAQTYIELSWFDKARQLLLHAQDLNPDLPDICVNLGVLAWYTGKTDEATMLFEKAARMGKNVQSAINNEANILFLSGVTGRAIDKYRKADRTGAKNEAVLANLANACLALGRLDDAASSFEALIALSPSRIDVLEKLAAIAVRRKKDADAVVYYRKILEQEPRNQDALVKMAEIMMADGQFKEAAEPIDAYLADMPNEKKILLLQADLYRKMGWYEVAIMKYQVVTRDFPGDAEGYLGLGKSMYDLIQHKNSRDCDKTLGVLAIAARLAPAAWEPEYITGLVYRDCKGNPDLAKEQWRSALSKAKEPDTRNKISDLIEKAGR